MATFLRNTNLGRHRLISVSPAVRQDSNVWTTAALADVVSAAESLYNVTIVVSDSPDLLASYTRPGQYIHLRLPDVGRTSLLSISSPPSTSSVSGVFEFLVKSIAGSTAELLCRLRGKDLK